MSNKYLFNEEPKSFSPTIAKALGSISKAVIMQQVHFWLHVYTKKADQRHFFDGYYWVFNSYTEWHKDLEFIPFATMKRQILELERDTLLVSSEFNKNRGDRTKWYRINYERLTVLTTGIELNRLVQIEPPSDHFEPPSDHFEPPSDHFEPPSDHFDPLYIQSDQQSDQLIDQQKKRSVFFENLTPEEKTSDFSDLSKPKDQETPPPPTPAAPLPPENSSKTIAVSKQAERYQQFEARFSRPKPMNRYIPLALVEAGYGEWHNGSHPLDWRKSLIDVCIQRKKKRGDESTVGAATDFIANIIGDCIKLGMWTKFQNLVDAALTLEQSQQQRSQQLTPITVPPEDNAVYTVPSFVKDFASKSRKAS